MEKEYHVHVFLLVYIVPRNFLGLFRGNFEEHMFGVSKHQFFLPYIISYTNAMHTIEESLYR